MVYKQLDNQTGELKFYGDISEWWISGEDFTRTIEEMAGKFKTIHIRAHCYGGSVFEGIVMYNAILRCKSTVIVYIDGVSASMFTIVMLAAAEIIIAENGFVMVHCPTGYQVGNAKQMLQTANLLKSMETTFGKTYIKKTGKTQKDVEAWFDGADHWFSAEEALANGLVTKISNPVVENVVDIQTPTEDGQEKNIFGRFAALLTDSLPLAKTQENVNMKKELIAKFGLTGVTEASTDAEITAALEQKLKDASTAGDNAVNTAVEAIVAGMEKATNKAYDAEIRANLITVGKTSGLTVLQSMLGLNVPTVEPAAAAAAAATTTTTTTTTPAASAVPKVITMLNGGAANAAAGDRSGWSWDKWQAEDQAGLADMEANKPDEFKALYQKEFGRAL